jgi:F-box interacting protein
LLTISSNHLSTAFLYGFGYDASTDDYLVIVARMFVNMEMFLLAGERLENCEETRVQIFSLRANAWEELKGPHLFCPNSHEIFSRVGLPFNGAINWIAGKSRSVIIAFDLMEKVFYEIALPNDFNRQCGLLELRVLGGIFCLCDVRDTGIEIWMMKEYKVQSLWTKSHIVLPSLRKNNFRYFSVICFTKNGDVVGKHGDTELVRFDDKGVMLERRDYCDYEKKCTICSHPKESHCACGKRSQAVTITESLLSLPCDSQQAEETTTIR